MTWEFRVVAGAGIERFAGTTGRGLQPGEVRVEFLAGGICGSDIGALADLAHGGADSAPPMVPIHEVVGRVVESRDDRHKEGVIVVGTCLTGLASSLVERGDHLIPVPQPLSPTEAITIQPLATVLRAVRTLPPVAGESIVVLGAGAIGLAFIHMLSGMRAGRITAVDPVAAREPLARAYGADEFVAATGERWAEDAAGALERPGLVIDAVGRRPALIGGALRAVADDGFVLGFGSAGGGEYRIPFDDMYHRRLTLASGRTRDRWTEVLDDGAEYLLAHRADFADYVSARFSIDQAREAYQLCSEPNAERVKVALLATT